jgi:hypothetical protein
MSLRMGSSSLLCRAAVVAVMLSGATAAPAGAVPPEVTIDSGPSGPTNESSPTFEFTHDGLTAECSVDQGTPDFVPCTTDTSHMALDLADGSWTFRVMVTSEHPRPALATRDFVVDTDPPEVTIDDGPSGPTNDATPTFEFTAEAGATVECSVDQGSPVFGPCTSDATHSVGPLADGNWFFRVRATDEASNVTTTPARPFSVDTVAPSVTIDSGPSGPTGNPSPTFGFTPEAGTAVECSIDQGTADFGACTSGTTHATGPLAEGSWTFRVRVTDTALNATTATRTFTVDTELPTVLINSGPSGPTSDASPSFAFTPEAGTTVECSVDQGTPAFGPCTSRTTHAAGFLPDGTWTFRIRVTDAGSNSAIETQSFTVDTTGPRVVVAGPKRTGQRRPTFRVSSDDPGATFTCALDSGPAVQCGPTFRPDRKLKPRRHTLLATAFDALENRGQSQTFRFKVLRPALRENRARRTVAIALRRHDFAKRVIRELEETCNRRGRFRFFCRFSSTFPGYRLSGSGTVLSKQRLSYRFRVRAQGRSFVLKDENEGRMRARL